MQRRPRRFVRRALSQGCLKDSTRRIKLLPQDILLAGEVSEERATGSPCGPRDVVNRGGFDALADEQIDSYVPQFLP